MARFPNRLRYFRVKAGWSQPELGKRIGRGRGVISAWERGLYLPSLRNAFRLARTFNVTVEQMYSSYFLRVMETERKGQQS